MKNAASRLSLIRDLRNLGVEAGSLVMVHASLRSVGPVAGGAAVVVQALLDVLGEGGTLAAYVDFEPFYDDETAEADIPIFDKRLARAALDHGVLHETIRTWPGALRSDHPDAGVAAIGARAQWLISDHPFQYGYGKGSPFEKVVDANGYVLMLGAPLDTITLLHYAEDRANIPGKRILRYRRHMGEDAWVDFEEFDTGDPVNEKLPDTCFEIIALDFLESGHGKQGKIAKADSYLFQAQELVPFAIEWIERAVNSTNSK